MGTSVLNAFKDDLKDNVPGKGSFRFQAGKPLPSELVRKLVRARIAENLVLSKKK